MERAKRMSVEKLRKALETIDLKAEAGLCCMTHASTRGFLKDIRDIVDELGIQGGLTKNRAA